MSDDERHSDELLVNAPKPNHLNKIIQGGFSNEFNNLQFESSNNDLSNMSEYSNINDLSSNLSSKNDLSNMSQYSNINDLSSNLSNKPSFNKKILQTTTNSNQNVFSELSSKLSTRDLTQSDPSRRSVDLFKNKQTNETKNLILRPNDNDLTSMDYFFPNISRDEATEILKNINEDGTFIIRIKEGVPLQPYSMSIFYNNEVNHLEIRRLDPNKYALGKTKDFETFFESVPQMVNFFCNNMLGIIRKGMVKLKINPKLKNYK